MPQPGDHSPASYLRTVTRRLMHSRLASAMIEDPEA